MIINTNVSALNANRMANINAGNAAKAMQQLSSGLRINNSSDDAAGLAISTKMQGQINGLNQATSNAQTGVSMVQTADGALTETTAVLQRMRELAVQSASDTNTTSDRTAMQTETTALTAQIDNIATTTQFNTKNLLDGSMGAASVATANVQTSDVLQDGSNNPAATATLLTAVADGNGNSLGISSGDTITANYTLDGTQETSGAVAITAASTLSTVTAGTDSTTAVDATGHMVSTSAATGKAGSVEGLTFTVANSAGVVNTAASTALSSFAETSGATDVHSNGTAVVQIGANAGQNIGISINDMGSEALGVKGIQIGTQVEANTAIKVIDNAAAIVSSQQASLGATENRLTSTITNLGTTSQNLTSAESNITDVDMAATMAEYSKDNVEAQAAQAMIAQANQQPSQVLSLLR